LLFDCRHPSDCADPAPCVQSQKAAVLDLDKIWVGTSEDKLIALSNEFPGVYRYALIMEEASESNATRLLGPMTAWPSFPNSTSNWWLNCWQWRQQMSAAIRRFLGAERRSTKTHLLTFSFAVRATGSNDEPPFSKVDVASPRLFGQFTHASL
jgi:hypothetical protein